MHLLRSLFYLMTPGALFALALYLHLVVATPGAWQPILDLFPYVAVAAGLLIGWRFNRTRVLWAIALIVLVDRSLVVATPFAREYLLLVTSVLVPLNIVLFSLWSERGLFTMHGLMRLLVVLAQVALVAWLYRAFAGELMALIERPLVASDIFSTLPLPQIPLLVHLLCLIGLFVRFSLKPEALEGSFCWIFAALGFGLARPESFSFWGGVAAFLLTVAIIESSFRMAFNDELTGLPARRAMNEFLLKVGRRYTIAMVDVDHFKKVNDTYGHDVGDQVLRMVATCLRRVSGGGRAYRYGGEEFAVIFPSKDVERALPHLEELRETIAQAGFVVRGKKRPKQKPDTASRKTSGRKNLQVTVSIGVASRDEKRTTPEALLKAADQALYRAKKGGRNQVCSA